MAGHAQLKFVMTECSKTQIRLTGLMYRFNTQARYEVERVFQELLKFPWHFGS